MLMTADGTAGRWLRTLRGIRGPAHGRTWERRGHVYTDLVVESQTGLGQQAVPAAAPVPGFHTEARQVGPATVTRMLIETEQAARTIGKAVGFYSTIEAVGLRERDEEVHKEISHIMAQEVDHFLKRLGIGPDDPVLVVGLGNASATPDSLGPKVVSQLLVTRHLHQMVPPEVRGGLRPLAALSPGVLGTTGIETGEIIFGVVHRIHPALVICVDALAARSSQRLGTTIQMADSGIQPGSGVGNKRFAITRETLGVPVLAVGVPTVIHAATIISDGMEALAAQGGGGTAGAYSGAPGPSLPPEQKEATLRRLLSPFMGDLIVTPKDVDVMVDDIAQTLAAGLNAALHPSLDLSNVLQYLN